MRNLLAIMLVVVVAACSTIGTPVTPETPREKLVAAEVSYELVLTEVKSLTLSGLIMPGTDLADGVALSIVELRTLLDVWQADPDSPNYLAAANSALLRLQQYLIAAKAQGASLSTETMSMAYKPVYGDGGSANIGGGSANIGRPIG